MQIFTDRLLIHIYLFYVLSLNNVYFVFLIFFLVIFVLRVSLIVVFYFV